MQPIIANAANDFRQADLQALIFRVWELLLRFFISISAALNESLLFDNTRCLVSS